jgi:hypothetical protein
VGLKEKVASRFSLLGLTTSTTFPFSIEPASITFLSEIVSGSRIFTDVDAGGFAVDISSSA